MARDLVCSAALLGLAAGYYFLAAGIGRSALSDEVGPGGLPILYAVILAVLAVVMAVSAILRSWLATETATRARSSDQSVGPLLRGAAGVLAIGIGYLLLVRYTGYLPGLILVISTTAIYFGERTLGRVLLISVAGASVFWLLFVLLLGIPMPTFWSS